MGWLKLLLNSNNAEGAREAVRLSYRKHFRGAKRGAAGRIGMDDPHKTALYGALASRYKVRGMRATEPDLWAELLPFLLMKEADSVEALAEYVVYQERPKSDVIFSRLQPCLNAALRTIDVSDQERSAVVWWAFRLARGYSETAGKSGHPIAWFNILDMDVRRHLDLLINSTAKQKKGV